MAIFKRKRADQPDTEEKQAVAAAIEQTRSTIDDTSVRIARIQAQVRVYMARLSTT